MPPIAVRVIACAASLLVVAAEAASPMLSEGDLHYAGYLSYNRATQDWNSEHRRVARTCTATGESFANYLSWGYSYYWTLLGSIGLGHTQCGSDSRTGLSDLQLGVRGQWDVYSDERVYEINATIPTNRDQTSLSRIDCGAYGLAGTIANRNRFSPFIAVGEEATVQFWESPLVHQFESRVSFSGRFGFKSNWGWYNVFGYRLPITDGPASANRSLSDCGTDSRVLRGTWQVKYLLDSFSDISCGVNVTLWGEDVSDTRSITCGYARTWPN